MRKYLDCRHFSYPTFCPHGNTELMKQFVSDMQVFQSSVPIPLDFSKQEEINKLCSTCEKFEPNPGGNAGRW